MSLRAYARSHRFVACLTLIAIAGFVLRVIYAVASRHLALGGDGLRYHYGALLLADGEGFLNPLIFMRSNVRVPDTGHPPGWTVLLAGPTLLGLRTWLEHGIVTSVVGTATIAMTGLAGREAFGRRAGLIAAALAAVYPFVWLYEREVLSEPLAMLGVATVIWLAYRFIAAPGPVLAIALGAVVGVLAMTKSDQLAIAVLLVVPLVLSRRDVDVRRRFGWLAMAGAVCFVIIAPWSIYLSARYDRPVLPTGSLGAAMAAGNCAETYEGELFAYYGRNTCTFGSPGLSGDPVDRDRQRMRGAIDFMRAHQRRVPVVMAARLGRTFGFFHPFQQMRLETERGSSEWVFRVGFFAYWAVLPLAVAGAVIARRRKIPIFPLLVFPVVVVWSVLLTIGSVRYRAPAEIPLVILAAFALDAAVVAWRRRGAPAEPEPPQAVPRAGGSGA